MLELVIVVENDGEFMLRIGPIEALADFLENAHYSSALRVVSVWALDGDGQLVPVAWSVSKVEYDRETNMAYPTVTVEMPTGTVERCSMMIDGRG